MTALEIRPDEIGQFDLAAYRARRARMLNARPAPKPVTEPVPLRLYAITPPPPPPPIKKKRRYAKRSPYQMPTNARPDLAFRIYRWPLRVGCMVAARTKNPDGSKMLPGEVSELFNPAAFLPVEKVHLRRVTPMMIYRAIEPGCPPGFSAEEMDSGSRNPIITHGRQIAIYCAMRGFGLSSAEVGRRFRIDHSTALYAEKKVRFMIDRGLLADPVPYVTGQGAFSLAAE